MAKDLSKLSDAELEAIASGGKKQKDLSAISDEDLERIASGNVPKQESYFDGLGGRMLQSFENAGRSMLGGRTLGISEPIVSGINAVGNSIINDGTLDPDTIKKNYLSDVERRRAQRAAMPAADIIGQITGGMSPGSLIGKTAETVTQGIRAATGGLGAPAKEGAGILARAGAGVGRVVQGGLEGAGTGAVLTAANNFVGEKSGFIKPGEAPAVGDGAMFGGAIGAGIPAIAQTAPLAWRGAKETGKFAMSVLLGPKRDVINGHLQKAEMVRGAQSVEQMKNLMDDSMASIFDDVEKGKLSVSEAKEAVKLVDDRIKDATRDAQFQFRISRADIKDMFNESKQNLENSFKAQKENLQAIKSPIQLADDVQTSLQELKGQVSKASSEGYEILANAKQTVNLQQPFRELGKIRDGMMIRGQLPITNEGRAAFENINTIVQRAGEYPVQLTGPEAKQIIQELDGAIEYGMRNGAFTPATSKALQSLRRGIDAQLKTVPGYAEKMKEASELATLLKSASEIFGTPQSAVSKLNSIAGRAKGIERDTLGALGSATGRDFLSPVDQFVKAQSVLKDDRALEQIKRGLPEYKKFRLQSMANSQSSRPEASVSYVQGEINRLGLPMERAKAEEGLAAAIERLKQAQERLEPVKSLTPLNTQNAIQGLMKAPGKENIELRRTVEHLSKLSGKDFINWIEARRIHDAFNVEYRNGARNVGLWGLVGFVTGGGPVGAAALGAIGGIVDRFGPKMAQKILDGVLKIQGTPSAQKIQALDLPPNAKDYLIQSWTAANSKPEDAIARRMRKIGGE